MIPDEVAVPAGPVAAVPWRETARDLVRIRPVVGVEWVAVRAGVAVLVPLLVLLAAGRPEWAIYATFGAFTSVYGGADPSPARLRLQVQIGLLLTAAVASGALVGLSPQRSWWSIPVTAAWAVLAAGLSDRFAWRPPGPMFPVFAVAACAAIPTEPATMLAAVAVSAATAAFAFTLGVVDQRIRGRLAGLPTAGSPPPLPTGRRRLVHALRCGVAVVVAGVLATASGIGHPYWAMVAAVVPLAALRFRDQVLRGVHRAIGTVLGLVVTGVLLVLPLPDLVVVLVVALLQAIAELLVARNYGLALVFITPLALLLGHLAAPQPTAALLRDRLLETLIGVSVGVEVATVTRLRPSAADGQPPDRRQRGTDAVG